MGGIKLLGWSVEYLEKDLVYRIPVDTWKYESQALRFIITPHECLHKTFIVFTDGDKASAPIYIPPGHIATLDIQDNIVQGLALIQDNTVYAF